MYSLNDPLLVVDVSNICSCVAVYARKLPLVCVHGNE